MPHVATAHVFSLSGPWEYGETAHREGKEREREGKGREGKGKSVGWRSQKREEQIIVGEK
jgi:hypothetical protein